MNAGYAKLVENFKQPGADYGPAMMWFWIGEITKEGITFQLEKFREKKITNFFIHAAYGFMQHYMSDEHMELIKHVVAEAKRLGMYYWIYDEYEYPSGTAGGLLLKKYPECRQKEIHVEERFLKNPGQRVTMYRHGKFIGAQMIQEKNGKLYVRDIADECIKTEDGEYTEIVYLYNEANTEGRALFYFEEIMLEILPSACGCLSSEGTGGYVDMLSYDAVGKYIELTHERYKEVIGDEFGKTVRGVFTDEPTTLRHFDGTYVGPWSDTFPAEFEKDHGYSILPYLYCFWHFPVHSPEEIKAIHDYRYTIKRLYHKNFGEQIHEWCKKNNLLFTGHFGGEEILTGHVAQGDMLEHLTYLDVPGLDCIFSSDQIDTCYGFNLAAKNAVSAAKFAGVDRVLAETYTGSGWWCRLPLMKRIANRLMMLGVNWIQYMGAHYSIHGKTKNHPGMLPPSHSYQNTLYAYYDKLGDHMAAFSNVSANTKTDNSVLMLIPVQQAEQEEYIPKGNPMNEWRMPWEYPYRYYADAVNALLYEGIGFDLYSENMLDKVVMGDGFFTIEGYRYETVVFPKMYYVNTATKNFIADLKAHNVKMIFTYDMPTVETNTGLPFDLGFDMQPYNKAKGISKDGNSYHVAPEGLPVDMGLYRSIFRDIIGAPFLNKESDNMIYITKRANADADAYFICNDDMGNAVVYIDALPGMEIFDSEKETVEYTVENGRIRLEIEPWNMLCAICPKDGGKMPETTKVEKTLVDKITMVDPYDFTVVGGNMLPLTYEQFDKQLGEWVACPYISYNQEIHMDPGEDYKLRANLKVNYLPEEVFINAEVQNLTRLAINGTDLAFCKNVELWSTKDFRQEVASLLHVGNNIIEVEGTTDIIPMIQKPPYIFFSGDFTVGHHDTFDVMEPAMAKMVANGWEKNGYYYYTGMGIYKTKVTVDSDFNFAALTVNAKDIAEVYVNGEYAGTKLWVADETDISKFLKKGENEIEVRITSTRANSFACVAYLDEWGTDSAERRTQNGILAPMTIQLYK